jgi:predicted transcriptional regulator
VTLNPYATFLGEGDAVAVIAATPTRLVAVTSAMTAEQADVPIAPGKWSVRQIVAHLADCEIAFGFRLRQALAGVSIQPFDQDAWAESYRRYSLAAALKTFTALREWNVALILGISDADKGQKVTHPERGEMTVWTIVETMAGHDLNHLSKLE